MTRRQASRTASTKEHDCRERGQLYFNSGVLIRMSRVELALARMMRNSEARMTPDSQRKIDELASDLDDLTITAEELETDSSVDAQAELERLKRALEEASNATDALDETVNEPD